MPWSWVRLFWLGHHWASIWIWGVFGTLSRGFPVTWFGHADVLVEPVYHVMKQNLWSIARLELADSVTGWPLIHCLELWKWSGWLEWKFYQIVIDPYKIEKKNCLGTRSDFRKLMRRPNWLQRATILWALSRHDCFDKALPSQSSSYKWIGISLTRAMTLTSLKTMTLGGSKQRQRVTFGVARHHTASVITYDAVTWHHTASHGISPLGLL
jgi:hypothetical protein